MLQNIKNYYGKKLGASDGALGQVKDFYFDDKTWAVRYLVADTENWLTGRKVLLAPHSFQRIDSSSEVLQVNLTRKQIEDSPSIATHLPVSRQYEEEYYHYYGLPAYWQGGEMWGMGAYPVIVPPPHHEPPTHLSPTARADLHLRSSKALDGYLVQATDGPIGHLTGFMMDDKSWVIEELLIETGHWYAGREVSIPTGKVSQISYEDSKVQVNLTEEEIKHSPTRHLVKA